MELAAGLDFGGSSVKAWVATLAGNVLATCSRPVETLRPTPDIAEFEPESWWEAARSALDRAVEHAGRPPDEYVGVTAASLRQGFVLVADEGELGLGVLNSDRRGASQLGALRSAVDADHLYRLTGHWPAAELTLPKLMQLRTVEPDRWRSTRKVLFLHDWALWRMSGAEVTEPSLASAGQMADVRRRTWAYDLLEQVGIGSGRLAEIVDAGEIVGELRRDVLGLPAGIAVVAGGGDTQFAAMGSGGLVPATVTVVAGSSTPLQMTLDQVPDDPLRHPWVSTHLRRDLWAVENNAGYGGMLLDWLAHIARSTVDGLADEAMATSAPGARGLTATIAAPEWSEERWTAKAPMAMLGFTVSHSLGDVARAFIEGHIYAIRANLDDLERATGTSAPQVILAGGAARSVAFCRLLADVTGRRITVPAGGDPAAVAGASLVARALGATRNGPTELTATEYEPSVDPAYDEGFERFMRAGETMRSLRPKETQ